LAWLFLALLLLSARLGAIPASSLQLTLSAHLLLMLSSHSHLVPAHLLMMLLTHLLLMMHLLVHRVLIHCLLPAAFRHLVVSFGMVAFEVLLVAVDIFSLAFVRDIRGFLFTFSCSLTLMLSHVPGFIFTLPRTGSSCGSDAPCAFALFVALIK
jgi:hypothetical protein